MDHLAFSKRGARRTEGYGLYYRSRCKRYALYLSDQVGGIPIMPHRWLALRILPTQTVLSRHRKREAAARSCQRDARSFIAQSSRPPQKITRPR